MSGRFVCQLKSTSTTSDTRKLHLAIRGYRFISFIMSSWHQTRPSGGEASPRHEHSRVRPLPRPSGDTQTPALELLSRRVFAPGPRKRPQAEYSTNKFQSLRPQLYGWKRSPLRSRACHLSPGTSFLLNFHLSPTALTPVRCSATITSRRPHVPTPPRWRIPIS